MTIQTLRDVELANGVKVRAGAVLNVPDDIGAALIEKGDARLRERPGPAERKARLNPGDPLPPAVPYVRLPTDASPARSFEPGAYEDQDNFVRNLFTLAHGWYAIVPIDSAQDAPPVPPSPSASDRPPLLTLDQIKIHCHIESDQTAEDDLLKQYEMAARLHAENYLRYPIDDTVGENIKQACLMLVAHWYRNRETVSTGRGSVGAVMPLAFEALLFPERDFPIY